MKNSFLYASHRALSNLLWDNNIWSIYAYTSFAQAQDDGMVFSQKWKIKTRKFKTETGTFSFDVLKYADNIDAISHPIIFNFGWQHIMKVPGVRKMVLPLHYEYELEREVLEKICELSDNGHVIMSNGQAIMDKFKGSKFLVGIDIEAPTYSYLDN